MSTRSEASARQEALRALRSAGRAVEPRLRSSLRRLHPTLHTAAGYHLSWCDTTGRPVSSGGGKAVRPALVLLIAQACDGVSDDDAVMAAAAAVELVHNFSQLHDDVMDGDDRRRHRRAVWSAFDVSTAILLGDAMLMAAQQLLLDTAHPTTVEALTVLTSSVQRMVTGQAMDIAFESRHDVGLEEHAIMTAGKSAALMECSCTLGALYGGAAPSSVPGWRAFGHDLGMAFQYVDDLLGIWGDPDRTGKPVGSDLRRRKKSLPVVAALTSGTAAGRDLARMYRSPEPLSDHQVAAAAGLVTESGGKAWVQDRAEQHLHKALSQLAAMDVDPGVQATLGAIACLIADRDE
ncbi:polyprenyl synthetase family protein [Actinosynnema sp. NPDC050436]|uniref:polyprenyl synthetase family protein n=1 Tax=Actinosynnema sp. NPDC050436 TaxID=3155659 RepID=UPI0033EA592E